MQNTGFSWLSDYVVEECFLNHDPLVSGGINLPVETSIKNKWNRASLVAQWLRIRLPMQATRVRALVWEDPTCRGATSPWATITEPVHLEPVLRNKRGRDSERPAHRDEEWPPLATTRESPRTETKTQQT